MEKYIILLILLLCILRNIKFTYIPKSYTYCDYELYIANFKFILFNKKNIKMFIIPNADEFCGKANIWKNLSNKYGFDKACQYMPKTYILDDFQQMKKFKSDFNNNTIYILKKDIQQQQGLLITKNYKEIIKAKFKDYVVVQELLQKPYTIKDRKINLRIYLLIIIKNNKVYKYVYNDGFIYYTKVAYKDNSIDFDNNVTTGYIDRYIYSIAPLTHKDLIKHFEKNNINSKKVFKNIYHIIKKTIDSINFEYYNYKIMGQLFGVDISLDNNLKPLIMEINKGPDMNAKDKRDKELKNNVKKHISLIMNNKYSSNFIKI